MGGRAESQGGPPVGAEALARQRLVTYSKVFAGYALIQACLTGVLAATPLGGLWFFMFPLYPLFGIGLGVVRVWCGLEKSAGPMLATLMLLVPLACVYGVGCIAAAWNTKAYVIYIVFLVVASTAIACHIASTINWW